MFFLPPSYGPHWSLLIALTCSTRIRQGWHSHLFHYFTISIASVSWHDAHPPVDHDGLGETGDRDIHSRSHWFLQFRQLFVYGPAMPVALVLSNQSDSKRWCNCPISQSACSEWQSYFYGQRKTNTVVHPLGTRHGFWYQLHWSVDSREEIHRLEMWWPHSILHRTTAMSR